ncbi:MAG: PAS domain S-box protein [Nitrospirae bacterium]|nr:PAS domain S-box protein [Nitrospirota bacterium]
MKIRTKLQIGVLMAAVIVMIVGFILYYERLQDEEITNRSKIYEKLVKDVFEMNILVYDSLQPRVEIKERVNTQWQSKYNSLSNLLPMIKPKDTSGQELLVAVIENINTINTLFHEINKLKDDRKNLVKNEIAISLETEANLITQVVGRSQTVVSLASQLYDLNHKDLQAVHHKAHLLIIASIVFLTLFMIMAAYFVNQGISRPIVEISKGMQIIGAGNLDYKLGVIDASEIGEIAALLNTMALQLKETTVSRDMLAAEVKEREKVEKELQKSSGRFIRLSQATTEAIVISEKGIIIDTNEQMGAIFGYKTEEMTGMAAAAFVIPEERQRIKNIMSTGYEQRYETTGLRKDGATIDLSIHGKTLVCEGSHMRITSIRDITDYKAKEKALIQEKLEWKKTFDSIPDLIMILDGNHKIMKMNETMANRLKITPEEAIGQTCCEVVHATDKPLENCPHKQLLEDGLEHTIETYEGRLSGYFMVTTSPLYTPDGTLYGSVHIARDISHIKHIQNELFEENEKNKAITIELEILNKNLEEIVKDKVEEIRHNEQLLIQQSKMAAMGEMIGAIAHQWRQPLNSLSLVVQDLKDAHQYGEIDADYIDNTINITMNQVDFMSKTIDLFRNFFKPSKEKETFDLIEVSADVFSLLSSQFRTNSIAYRITCHIHNLTFRDHSEVIPCDGTVVTTYRNHLAHVLLNIISNAKDAIIERREKGLLTDEGIVAVDCYKEGGTLKVEISDNGGGIPEDVIDKIFEPYFMTKADKGTGIGLYMSKIIVEDNLGGKIYAKNTENGSVFTIELNSSQ